MQRYCTELTERLLKSLDKDYNVSSRGGRRVLDTRRWKKHTSLKLNDFTEQERETSDQTQRKHRGTR